jgi:hypothetical protein
MNRRDFLKNCSAAIAFAALPAVAADPSATPPGYTRVSGYERHYQFSDALKSGNQIGKTDSASLWADFKPDHQYGNGLHLTAQPTPAIEEKMLETLWENLCTVIPPPYRDQIYVHGSRVDYNRGFQLAWKYDPRPQTA